MSYPLCRSDYVYFVRDGARKMTEPHDYAYYINRAATQRELARAASDESVAEAHIEAAVRFENLAKKVALEEDLSGDRHC